MDLKDLAIKKLNDRGVTIDDIAELTLFLQEQYVKDLCLNDCKKYILDVLEKRETINAVLTGIAIDEAVENNLLDKEISALIKEDAGLYGIDEILALSIVNVHGSIALTNFGYADKIKPGIVRVIDNLGKQEGKCHTFLDDIIAAIAASASARIAHYGIEKQ
jgi:phosphatidylglycerophosphatase A